MMLTAIEHPGPAALRYPRGSGHGADIIRKPQKLQIGKAEIIRNGNSDVVIIAYGSMVYPSIEAAEMLEKDGIDASVVNARFVKPLDADMILSLAATHPIFVTVEEAYLAGGFGSAVMELLEANAMLEKTQVHRMGVPDQIVTHGDPKLLLSQFGLDADGIYKKVKEAVSRGDRHPKASRLKAVK
jgi:1-deoxy-D-xylulose-5-phosphate synthase